MIILTTLVMMTVLLGIGLAFIVFRQINQIDELREDVHAHQARIKVLGRLVHDLREENLPAINRRPRTGWWESLQADADAHNGV